MLSQTIRGHMPITPAVDTNTSTRQQGFALKPLDATSESSQALVGGGASIQGSDLADPFRHAPSRAFMQTPLTVVDIEDQSNAKTRFEKL